MAEVGSERPGIMSRSEPGRIAEAAGQVIEAGQRLIARRADLFRVQAREDLTQIGRGVVLTAAGSVAGVMAIGLCIVGLALVFEPSLPWAALGLGVAAIFSAGIGLGLMVGGFKSIKRAGPEETEPSVSRALPQE